MQLAFVQAEAKAGGLNFNDLFGPWEGGRSRADFSRERERGTGNKVDTTRQIKYDKH